MSVAEKAAVAAATDVEEGKLLAVEVDGRSVLLSRVDGQVCAVENRCPHLGLSMTRGKIADGVVQCPWHGSRYEMCSGANVDWVNSFAGMPMPRWTHRMIAMGKEPAPLTTLAVEELDGKVYVSQR